MAGDGALPSDAVLAEHISTILRSKDLTQTSLKEVRSSLEQKLGFPEGALDSHKAKVKELTTAEIARITAEQGSPEGEAQEEEAAQEAPSAGMGSKAKRKKSDDGPGATKKKQATCMTRKQFEEQAQGFTVDITGKKLKVAPKVFSTGSCGFYAGGKFDVKIGGATLTMQCQVNCAIIGSKLWDDE